TIAFAPYTPSHFLLWNRMKSSGLTTEQRNEVFSRAVHTKDGIEPATLFAQQKVDAAVAWDPDMSDAVTKRSGSKKIYDTRVANRLIADILRSEEHTSELQSRSDLVCRLLLEKKKKII